ncbi:MAG: response regulator [Bacteroidia bacterium]|nr:response regulator [Bacteroidia bacterium]
MIRPGQLHIGIIEDNLDLQQNLAEYLEAHPDTLCPVQATDYESFFAQWKIHPHLNMILCDINLPGERSGIDCVRTIRRQSHEIDIIMLTVHDNEDYIFDALYAGAKWLLAKRQFAGGSSGGHP